MAGECPGAGSLSVTLDRHRADATRMADSLLELDRHPGHRLLASGAPSGETGRRWDRAGPVLHGLWRDFDRYRDVLDRAQEVRERRSRPGQREVDELTHLLVEPTIEVARHVVALDERGLTGAPERVETISLEALAGRMHAAYREVVELVVRCDELSTAALAALSGPAGRVRAARAAVVELGLGSGDPDADAVDGCLRRLAELEALAVADPLAFDREPPGPLAAELDDRVARAVAPLDRLRSLRRGWPRVRAELGAAVEQLPRQRAETRAVHERAAARVAVRLPPLPADRAPELRAALDRLDAVAGWTARESGADGVRRAAGAATAELDRAREAAAGLLERREELRGRFHAYRARAVRLGRAEDPRLLELGARIESTLWSRPSDLAAATRDLSAYRQRIAAAGSDAGREEHAG